jgi:hypothetical protein
MVLIGAGQGLAFAPMTSAGLAGTGPADAGAASGLVNTFHQLGSALGLAVLAAIGSAAVPAGTNGTAALIYRVHAALTGSSVLLVIALASVIGLIATRPRRPRAAEEAQPEPRPEREHTGAALAQLTQAVPHSLGHLWISGDRWPATRGRRRKGVLTAHRSSA